MGMGTLGLDLFLPAGHPEAVDRDEVAEPTPPP
jgi:hypothetical protein